jgi:tetratricopeptide (TPR) repeat protein
MAKGKKTTAIRATAGFGMKTVDVSADVRRIYRLFADGDRKEAYSQIARLCERHPDDLGANQLMADLALDLDEMQSYGKACVKLMQLQPKNANHIYGFAGTLISYQRPLLALQMMQKAIALDPHNSMAKDARKMIAVIEQQLDDLLEPVYLPREDAIAVLTLHEWAQVYLNWGDYEKCRKTELEVLRLKPDMLPAMNNLSLVAHMEGDLKEAIAQSENVLAIEPDNIHALSNLVHYCLLAGERDRAKEFAERAKLSQAKAWDPWTKKFEALSCIGDYAAVVELWQTVKQDKTETNLFQGIAFHLVAVALARMGQVDQAKPLWRKALSVSPDYKIAWDNLDNISQPIGQRHAPWTFEADYWLPHTVKQGLVVMVSAIAKEEPNATINRTCRQYFTQHPEAINWMKIIFEQGDPVTAQIIVSLIKYAELPQLWEVLKEFALGQQGSDKLRNDAAMALVQAGQLDPEKVRMWLKGEWHEISLITYQFHDEPPFQHSRKVKAFIIPALGLLKTGTQEAAIEAEKLLQQALAIRVTPDILNNLAVAYQLQNRHGEAKALCEQIIADHPDYVPARVTLASYHLKQQEIDQADALLKPILKRTNFHIDDLAIFSEGYLQLLVQQKEIPAAQTWLKLWEQVTPDHPRIQHWHRTLNLLSVTGKVGMVMDKITKPKKRK